MPQVYYCANCGDVSDIDDLACPNCRLPREDYDAMYAIRRERHDKGLDKRLSLDEFASAAMSGMLASYYHAGIDVSFSLTKASRMFAVQNAVEVVPGCQLPWFASERREKRGLK